MDTAGNSFAPTIFPAPSLVVRIPTRLSIKERGPEQDAGSVLEPVPGSGRIVRSLNGS